MCSPFRKPLARFLNRAPIDTLQYFMAPKQLGSEPVFGLFLCLLKDFKEMERVWATVKQDCEGNSEGGVLSTLLAMQVVTLHDTT